MMRTEENTHARTHKHTHEPQQLLRLLLLNLGVTYNRAGGTNHVPLAWHGTTLLRTRLQQIDHNDGTARRRPDENTKRTKIPAANACPTQPHRASLQLAARVLHAGRTIRLSSLPIYVELNTNRQEQASDPTHCTFDSADGLGRRCDFSFSP